MQYQYQAINNKGEIEDGMVEAGSFKEVLYQLAIKQLVPIDVRTMSQNSINNQRRLQNLRKLKEKLGEKSSEKSKSDPIMDKLEKEIEEPPKLSIFRKTKNVISSVEWGYVFIWVAIALLILFVYSSFIK